MKFLIFLFVSLVVVVTAAFNQASSEQNTPKLPATPSSEHQNDLNTLREAGKIMDGTSDLSDTLSPGEATQIMRDTIQNMHFKGTFPQPPAGQAPVD